MNDIKNNKLLIIICSVLIVFFGLISYFINNKEKYIGETIEYKEYNIKKYDANQFIPVYVTENDIVNKYLNDFKNMIIYDLEGAYELLNQEYRDKKYGSFDKFKERMNDLMSISFYKLNVKEYSLRNNNGSKYYYVKTNLDNTFIFKENSIMNYEVFLDDYTVKF